jgi:hypothetical protein
MDLGERGALVVMLEEILGMLPESGEDVASWLPEPFLPPD